MEIGAQWAIKKKDVDIFERYMAQLKCYYLDYRLQFIICFSVFSFFIKCNVITTFSVCTGFCSIGLNDFNIHEV